MLSISVLAQLIYCLVLPRSVIKRKVGYESLSRPLPESDKEVSSWEMVFWLVSLKMEREVRVAIRTKVNKLYKMKILAFMASLPFLKLWWKISKSQVSTRKTCRFTYPDKPGMDLKARMGTGKYCKSAFVYLTLSRKILI